MNKIVESLAVESVALPREEEFETAEQLLAIPWVARYASLDGFRQFVQDRGRLMAMYQGGRLWRTVGHLKEPVEGVPVWRK